MAKDSSCRWHTEFVFTLTRPSAAAIDRKVAAARHLAVDGPGILCLPYGLKPPFLVQGIAHDDYRTLVGKGEEDFASAKLAFRNWSMFDLGWVRVVNQDASISPGQIVAVEAHTLGLWTLNLSRITQVIDTPTAFGFIYSTTQDHVEQGEERFLLELDSATGDLWYELEAVSRPRGMLAWMGYPVTRRFQHQFARDSHRRMREEHLVQQSKP